MTEQTGQQELPEVQEFLEKVQGFAGATPEAWGLLVRSANPFVKWIAENLRGYEAEAVMVLSALPATADELDDLAERQGWGGEYAYLRARAEDAGVFPGSKPMSEARRTSPPWTGWRRTMTSATCGTASASRPCGTG